LKRRKRVPWLVSAVVLAVSIPTLAWGKAESAAPPVAGFAAHDSPGPPYYWFQDAGSSDSSDNEVTVPAGSSVSFAYFGTGQIHNAYFVEKAPSECTSDPGTPAATSTQLPPYPMPGPWSGQCRFDEPGSYRFVCYAHTAMEGRVVVTTATATPTGTATATSTATSTSTPTATATATETATSTATPVPPLIAGGTPPAGTPTPPPPLRASLDKPASPKLKTFLKSGLKVSGACAAGGSGKVALTIKRASAKKLKLKGTTLATGTARCSGAGRMTATLKPSAAAKKALKRQRKALAATLTLTVGGSQATVNVTLK